MTEERPVSPSRRRPRLAGVIALVLSGLVLLFVIASLSLDEGEEDPIEIEGGGDVQELLGGIRQSGSRLGSPDAPVTVQVFNDLQCEPCAEFELDPVEQLINGRVRDASDVKLEFHHFPMSRAPIGLASYGAVAAGKQDYQWHFIELFFRNQDEAERRGISQELLDRVATAILNLNVELWQREIDDPDVRATLEADDELAAELKLPAEPAVIVEGPGGRRELLESPSLDEINDAIAQVR